MKRESYLYQVCHGLRSAVSCFLPVVFLTVGTQVLRGDPVDLMEPNLEEEWRLRLGLEYPGAKGTFDWLEFSDAPMDRGMALSADFVGGGAYVEARVPTVELMQGEEFRSIRIVYRAREASQIGVRLVDESGQTHQRRLWIEPNGEWNILELRVPDLISDGAKKWGYVFFGGANDGKMHGAMQSFSITLSTVSWALTKRPSIEIGAVQVETPTRTFREEAAYFESFENSVGLATWVFEEDSQASIEPVAAHGSSSMRVAVGRGSQTDYPIALGPTVDVFRGEWAVEGFAKSDLYSPDSSYRVDLYASFYNGSGAKIGSSLVRELSGETNWLTYSTKVVAPAGASTLRLELLKSGTDGNVWLDGLKVRYLGEVDISEELVDRLIVQGDATGNLFLPDYPVRFVGKFVAKQSFSMGSPSYRVMDWQGNEVIPSARLVFSSISDLEYESNFVIPSEELEEGKFYAVEVSVPLPGGKPHVHQVGFAVLAPANVERFTDDLVPFVSRNWDGRSRTYIELAKRFGIRTVGLWADWEKSEPYDSRVYSIDYAESLGLKWAFTTPAKYLEDGIEGWNEQNLYQGAKDFFSKIDIGSLQFVSLGNEPHGTADEVEHFVENGYRPVYTAIKEVAPNLEVVATSVITLGSGPEEIYWQKGMQNYSDTYDFHIYESYLNVDRIVDGYQRVMVKYGATKPLIATEVGLDSKGLPRRAVAADLIKKMSMLLSRGVERIGWFTFVYPNPEGKSENDAFFTHCMFNCHYNAFNPKQDAIAYYHFIGNVAGRSFAERLSLANLTEVHRYEGSEGDQLYICWTNESGSELVLSDLEEGTQVLLQHLDGSRTILQAVDGRVAFTISDAPVFAQLQGDAVRLQVNPMDSLVRVNRSESEVYGEGRQEHTIKAQGVADDLHIELSRHWSIDSLGGDVFVINRHERAGPRSTAVITLQRGGMVYYRRELPLSFPSVSQQHKSPTPPSKLLVKWSQTSF